MEYKEYEEFERKDISPFFTILRKVMRFKHENDFSEIIEKKKPQKIDWTMKPLEESGTGIMQYRVIANIDGRKVRIEKNNIYQPASFTKREGELFISKIMDKYPEIEQSVNLIKLYIIDKSKFEKVDTLSTKKHSV